MTGVLVPVEDYKVFASILNDFGEGSVRFTYGAFKKAMRNLGFKSQRGALVPRGQFGKKPFMLASVPKESDIITFKMQEEWKVRLFNLYGWTEKTFKRVE